MALLEQVLFWVHGMSAAAWFGAIFYRISVIEPKTFGYFRDRARYEDFSMHLAQGMRYFVIAGLLICGSSGFALMGLRWHAGSGAWYGLMAGKVMAWLGACVLFTYVSWVHWPRRSLAIAVEFSALRREGVLLAGGMVLLAGTGFALGQACRLALL